MSRVGDSPIPIPSGVTITVTKQVVEVKGPKGAQTQILPKEISAEEADNRLIVTRSSDDKPVKAKHGLMRSLINNMIIGVTEGYEKKLEVNGVGFKVNLSGKDLTMSLGFSHDVKFSAPEGVELSVDGNLITVTGLNKQQVGQTAAEIRALKKPEPYKGKGIKYLDEQIIRKTGKSAVGAEA